MAPIALKIAYIGGGSREWACKLMFDLALCPDLTGEVALYDIDMPAACLNQQLGNWLQEQPGVLSCWRYAAVSTLQEALSGADFAVISIQPGSLELMAEEIALAKSMGSSSGGRYQRSAGPYAWISVCFHLQGVRPSPGGDLPECVDHQLHQPDVHLHAHADPRCAGAQGFWLLS